jgi:hypothetical protein
VTVAPLVLVSVVLLAFVKIVVEPISQEPIRVVVPPAFNDAWIAAASEPEQLMTLPPKTGKAENASRARIKRIGILGKRKEGWMGKGRD